MAQTTCVTTGLSAAAEAEPESWGKESTTKAPKAAEKSERMPDRSSNCSSTPVVKITIFVEVDARGVGEKGEQRRGESEDPADAAAAADAAAGAFTGTLDVVDPAPDDAATDMLGFVDPAPDDDVLQAETGASGKRS